MDNVENGQLKDEPLSLMYMIPLSPYAGCSKSPGQGLRGSSTRPQVIAIIGYGILAGRFAGGGYLNIRLPTGHP